jgi:hypothetical protein
VASPRRARRWAALLLALCCVLGPAVAAWAQEAPADPVAVRKEVRDVMSRPEFSYEPSVLERIQQWLSDLLDNLFPNSGAGGGGFAGGVGPVVAWALIVAAVVAAVLAVVAVVRHRVPRAERDAPPTEAEIEHRRSAAEWEGDAERFEREGRWKDALRARYRTLVRTLVDRRQLPDVAGRTTGELRGDLRRTTPAAEADFDSASLLFELAWYADVPTGEDENRRFRDLAARVLAAPVTAHEQSVAAPADLEAVG